MRFAVGMCAALLLLGGCASVPPSGDEAVPGTSATASASSSGSTSASGSATATSSTGSSLAALTVGTCTGPVADDGEPTATITSVPCARSHSWEVASVVPLTAADYPGEAALRTLAATDCSKAFAAYVGVAVASSPYNATFVAPSSGHWPDPDARRLVCLVGTETGGLTASLKDHPVVFAETGQCLGEPASGSTSYPLAACSGKHLYEVYASSAIAGSAAPTDAALDTLYDKVCLAGFKKFVGVEVAKSKYEIQYFVLPSSLWKKYSDHRLVCSAGSPKGGVTGSLKGVKK